MSTKFHANQTSGLGWKCLTKKKKIIDRNVFLLLLFVEMDTDMISLFGDTEVFGKKLDIGPSIFTKFGTHLFSHNVQIYQFL